MLVTLHRGSQFVLSKIIRVGDTKNHILCSRTRPAYLSGIAVGSDFMALITIGN